MSSISPSSTDKGLLCAEATLGSTENNIAPVINDNKIFLLFFISVKSSLYLPLTLATKQFQSAFSLLSTNRNYLMNTYYHAYLTAFSKDFLTFYKCKSIKFHVLCKLLKFYYEH